MSTPIIAVTGASGFVGNALCHMLQRRNIGYRALQRKNTEKPACSAVNYDSKNSIKSALQGCHTLVHLIAKTHSRNNSENLTDYRKVNVDLGKEIALAAGETDIKRIVFLSSIKVNGEETQATPFDHNSKPSPTTAYGISKLEAELMLQEVCDRNRMELVIIRAPLIFSPLAKGNIASLRWAIEHLLPLPLGSINNQRSIIDLHQICELIYACCNAPQVSGKTLLPSSETLSTPDLVRKIGTSINRQPLLIPFPVTALKLLARTSGRQHALDKLCGNLVIDSSEAKRILSAYSGKP